MKVTKDKERAGHPFLFGAELDKQVKHYLNHLRGMGGIVNTVITLGVTEGIVKNADSNLLEMKGGHIVLTKSWAKSLLSWMGFVIKRGELQKQMSNTLRR